MLLSVVLPCFNPPHGWDQNVIRNSQWITDNLTDDFELIIVFDGCGKDIKDSVRASLQALIPALKLVEYDVNRGKGYAIRKGVAQAMGDIIIYTDVDFPYTQDSFRNLFNSLQSGANDAVIGIKDEEYYSHLPTIRRWVSKILQTMIRSSLSMPISDTQCGLKGFNTKVKPIFMGTQIDRYLFDLEFVKYCYSNRTIKVQPLQVTLNENVEFRKMNFKILIPELINFIKILFKRS